MMRLFVGWRLTFAKKSLLDYAHKQKNVQQDLRGEPQSLADVIDMQMVPKIPSGQMPSMYNTKNVDMPAQHDSMRLWIDSYMNPDLLRDVMFAGSNKEKNGIKFPNAPPLHMPSLHFLGKMYSPYTEQERFIMEPHTWAEIASRPNGAGWQSHGVQAAPVGAWRPGPRREWSDSDQMPPVDKPYKEDESEYWDKLYHELESKSNDCRTKVYYVGNTDEPDFIRKICEIKVVTRDGFDREAKYATLAGNIGIGPRVRGTRVLNGKYGIIDMDCLADAVGDVLNRSIPGTVSERFSKSCSIKSRECENDQVYFSESDVERVGEIVDIMWKSGFMHVDMHTQNFMYTTRKRSTARLMLIDYGRVIPRENIESGCHMKLFVPQLIDDIYIQGKTEVLQEGGSEFVVHTETILRQQQIDSFKRITPSMLESLRKIFRISQT